MWSNEIIQLDNKAKIALATNHIAFEDDISYTDGKNSYGGFLANGKYSWKVYESNLEVFCSRTGVKIAFHDFNNDASKNTNCAISCVKEIVDREYKTCLVTVAVNSGNCTGMIYIFMVKGSKVIGKIEVNEDITCIEYINSLTCNSGILNQYKGCAAVGTESGKIYILDLCLAYLEDDVFGRKLCMNGMDTVKCHMEFANIEPSKIVASHKILQEEGVYFGLQLESIDDDPENASPVRSLLEITPSIAIAVGLDDGRMILYDLTDLQGFHLSMPPILDTPLLQLTFIEPADDPKACIYIWAFHTGFEGAYAVMHSLMYEDKFLEGENHVYENFIACNTRLTMSCYDKKSIPIACQSIRKIANQEDEMLILCLLSWTTSRNSINTLIFDLNQWYKEEMPSTCDWRSQPNHIVIFPIETNESILSVSLDTESLIPFNSIQRPEEHFYPNSLTFDLKTLSERTCSCYHWVGLQNKALEFFDYNGPIGILDPVQCYTTLLSAALIPQFYENVFNRNTSIVMQREFLLSIALEYNYYNLLKDCAIKWADGSHLSCQPENGLSLSSLTDWIWNRAKVLKETSNKLCVPLFDHSGRRIDCGTQKVLWHCSNQLKFLSELFEMILDKCRQYIPENVIKSLKGQSESIKMASEYQEVLQWLLNVGLLPEGSENQSIQSNEFVLVPFPYQKISSFYKSRRNKLFREYEDQRDRTIPIEEQSSQHLYVDVFIEREFQNDALNKVWVENKGIYPPTSLQNVLRTLLLPNISTENKYILLIYVFLDIHESVKDERYTGIVQNLIKFPAVFKINPTIIKRTQALWFLDRGNIEIAVKELISPFSHDQTLTQWQREFLISTLLRQQAPHLALRVLRAPGLPISPFVEMKTLLINNLVSEAFKLQKSKRDPELLRYFFDIIFKLNRQEMLLELTLSEEDGAILREYLNTTKFAQAENLHFVYLLQRSHFIDAIHMVDSLDKKFNLNVPRDVLLAYNTTLDPTTQHLSQMAYTDKRPINNRQKPDVIDTLSSILIKKRNIIRNGLFNESINSIREASDKIEHQQPFLERPGMGIFGLRTQVQCNDICYPIVVHKKTIKRQLNQDNLSRSPRTVDIFNQYEKPSKRRKIDNDIISQNKSQFEMPKNVLTRFADVRPSFNFTANKEVSNFFIARNKSTSKSPVAELETPMIEKIRTEEENGSEDRQTPQSILKVASSVASSSNIVISKSLESEEKTIRFELPKILKSPVAEKPMTPTLNCSLISNDEFFSPEGSMEVQSFTENSGIEIKEFMSGPKARKPLRSRSNTPVETQNEIAIIIDDIEDTEMVMTEEYLDDTSPPIQSFEEMVRPTSSEESLNESQVGKILRRIDGPTARKSLSRFVLEKNSILTVENDETSPNVVEKEIALKSTEADSCLPVSHSPSNEIVIEDDDDDDDKNLIEEEDNDVIEEEDNDIIEEEDDDVIEEEDDDVVDEEDNDVVDEEDNDVVDDQDEVTYDDENEADISSEDENQTTSDEDDDDDKEGGLNVHDVISISSSSEDSIHKEARKLDAAEEKDDNTDIENENEKATLEELVEIGSDNEDPMIMFQSDDQENIEIEQSLVYEESDNTAKLLQKEDNYFIDSNRKLPEMSIIESATLPAGCSHVVHPMDFVVSQVQDNTVNLGMLVESQSSAALENIEQDHLIMNDDSESNCQNLMSTEAVVFESVEEGQQNVKIYEEMVSRSQSILQQEKSEKQEETAEMVESSEHDQEKSNENMVEVSLLAENAPCDENNENFERNSEESSQIELIEVNQDQADEPEKQEININNENLNVEMGDLEVSPSNFEAIVVVEENSKELEECQPEAENIETDASVSHAEVNVNPDEDPKEDICKLEVKSAEHDVSEEKEHLEKESLAIENQSKDESEMEEVQQIESDVIDKIEIPVEQTSKPSEESCQLEVDIKSGGSTICEEIQENQPSSTTDVSDTSVLDITPLFEDAQENPIDGVENLSVEQNAEIVDQILASPKKVALASTSGQPHRPVVAIEEAKDLSMSQSNSENESRSPIKLHDEVSNYENERELKRSLSTPKNAHEQIAPVMNLSVKPDEAHESDRVNKLDEPQSSPALNLSFENTDSGEKDSEFTLKLEEDEQTLASSTRGKRSVSVPNDLELPKTPTRRSRRLSVGDHSSTPQGALKKKIIQTLDKIEENSGEMRTPRRTRKISSTIEESTTPRTPMTRSRRASIAEQLDNVDTPLRSTRASSIIQDTPITSTPSTRKRKISESDNSDSAKIRPRSNSEAGDLGEYSGTPKKRRASSLAKDLDFKPTTPRRTRATSIPNDILETPKKGVILSVVKEETEEAGTPRKTRATSVTSNKETDSKVLKSRHTKKQEKLETPEKPVSEITSSHEDEEKGDESISLPKRQTRRPSAKESISEEPEQSSSQDKLNEYTTARRLTRAQTAVIKKSIQIDKIVRKTKSHQINITHDSDEAELSSDGESLVSNVSGTSKQSKRSSSRLKRKTDTEIHTDASVDTDMSESPKVKSAKLDTIDEESLSSRKAKTKPTRSRSKRK